jgi:two-component system, cell cycle sensor histidine kinase and response regulator CckA
MDPSRDPPRARTAVVVCDATREGFPIVDVDDGFTALTGYAADEVRGRGCSFLQGSDADPDAVAGMARALRAGTSHRTVLLNRRRDGTRFHNEVSLAPVRDASGAVVQVVGLLEDVTEREYADRRARVLAQSVDGADVAMWTTGPDLRIRTWNRGAERLYGHAAHDVIGCSHLDVLVPPRQHDGVRADLERLLVEGGTARHERTNLRAGGGEVPVLVTTTVVRGEDGAVTGLSSIAHDLRERVALEERLAGVEARLAGVLSSVPAIVWEADHEGRLLVHEGEALASIGLRPGEAVGRRIPELHDEPEVRDAWRRALAGERCEFTCVVRGVPFDAVHAPRLDADGRVTGTVGVALDATARVEAERRSRELEAHLEQAHRLETVGRLAGGVAHEFNNLLSVIRNYTAFIGDALPDDAALHADLGRVRAATDRAVTLTRQLLTAARQEVPQPRPLDVSALLRGMEPLLRQSVQASIDLELGLPAAPAVVHADPAQLEQVVLDLVVNARDAMPAGGRLALRVGAEEVRGADARGLAEGRYVTLRVHDTGEGMEPDVLARALDPFFTTKPPGHGTGLGLATAYGVATQAGGAIELESRPGAGTTVTVLLPVHVAAPAEGGAPVVLVVEDDEAVRELTRRILQREGLEVLTAADGAAGLEALEARGAPVDLVLTDVVMPVVSGKELADRVAERWPEVPVLFCSGYADDVVLRHGVEEGRYALLHKPFDAGELVAAVRARLAVAAR